MQQLSTLGAPSQALCNTRLVLRRCSRRCDTRQTASRRCDMAACCTHSRPSSPARVGGPGGTRHSVRWQRIAPARSARSLGARRAAARCVECAAAGVLLIHPGGRRGRAAGHVADVLPQPPEPQQPSPPRIRHAPRNTQSAVREGCQGWGDTGVLGRLSPCAGCWLCRLGQGEEHSCRTAHLAICSRSNVSAASRSSTSPAPSSPPPHPPPPPPPPAA